MQVKEPNGILDIMVTCRLSSCNLVSVYNVQLPIMLESERQAVYRERNRDRVYFEAQKRRKNAKNVEYL